MRIRTRRLLPLRSATRMSEGTLDAIAGGRRVTDTTMNGTSVQRAEASSRGDRAAPTAHQRSRLPRADARRRHHRAGAAERRHPRAGHRRGAGAQHLRPVLRHHRGVEPGDRPVRRPGADLRHPRHLRHRHADRRAGRAHDGVLPHRALPADPAPADRHRHRAAGRHPQHHLRHLGPVRVRAVLAEVRAAVPDRHVRQRAGAQFAVRRPALRHRHADRGPDPGRHGAALRHLDLARRVRRRAAGAQGGGLRRRLHDLGSASATSSCPTRGSA